MNASRPPVIAFNMRPRRGPWGGGNQWLTQVKRHCDLQGWRTTHRLDASVDCVLYTHAGLSGALSFGVDEVRHWKARNPELRVVHRINDNDIRKGTGEMDAVLAKTDAVADHTVFVSAWLRDYHAARWFDPARPHSVIVPGADPRAFHPLGSAEPQDGVWRIVTHHWSNNAAKGFPMYGTLDTLIAEGRMPGAELWIIGRWPADMRWRAAKTFGPSTGHRLGDRLRQCHFYISASQWEPGAMHVAEGLQCGLPLLYTADTGGTVEQGRKFGVLIGEDPVAAFEEAVRRRDELRRRILAGGPNGTVMCLEYQRVVLSLLMAIRL